MVTPMIGSTRHVTDSRYQANTVHLATAPEENTNERPPMVLKAKGDEKKGIHWGRSTQEPVCPENTKQQEGSRCGAGFLGSVPNYDGLLRKVGDEKIVRIVLHSASGVKEEEEEEEERLTPARHGTRALSAGARITAFSLQLQHETRSPRDYTLQLQMKSTEVDQGLFTDTYCKVCSAQLISESQRVAHYESRKHANKVRLYYMLHPVDGGCPAKKLRTHNGSEEGDVDKNKCCTLCNMSFTSAVVAESHYQGKIHAKRLKLVLGEQPGIMGKEVTPSPVKKPSESWPQLNGDSDRYCQLCHAWFNNPGMARQHYDGKKHKKNAARADLLEQLGRR
ncbi:hypothetical protein HF521_014881 [Silurus meridionalis]|uniref:Matrin-type domain-containing protein n=1 Tax=Silurus meridionalis TaxID=175797 RepID=A0A8T0A9E7_SILME|nr:hypothetical protein HF521_014881 [Silurus meridionalis]